MFDFAFSELVVVMLVALIVIGPQRLPKVARTMGLLFGRMQRFVSNVKNDISNDLAIEEARKLHDNIIKEAAAAERAVQETERAVQEDGRTLQQQILQAQYQNPPAAADTPPPAAETPVTAKPDENGKPSHS